MLAWFLSFSSAMEILEGSVALLTCYYAWRFYGLVREERLLKLFLAFLSIGLGLLAHGLVTAAVLSAIGRLRPGLTFMALRGSAIALFFCETVGYVLLALAYARSPEREAGTAVVLLPFLSAAVARPIKPEHLVALMRPHPALEGVALAILIYLCARTTSNFLSRRELNPFLVCFGFLFLAAARACFLLSFALAALYITGHILQLLAFLSVLLLLLRVRAA